MTNRQWVKRYRAEQATMCLCDDDRWQSVRTPPRWMLFWYDDAYDAS